MANPPLKGWQTGMGRTQSDEINRHKQSGESEQRKGSRVLARALKCKLKIYVNLHSRHCARGPIWLALGMGGTGTKY